MLAVREKKMVYSVQKNADGCKACLECSGVHVEHARFNSGIYLNSAFDIFPLHVNLLHGPVSSFVQDKLMVSCASEEQELQATTVAMSTYRKPKFEPSLSFLSQFVPSLLTLLCTVLALLEKMSASFLALVFLNVRNPRQVFFFFIKPQKWFFQFRSWNDKSART
jgi:hypothetical protein